MTERYQLIWSTAKVLGYRVKWTCSTNGIDYMCVFDPSGVRLIGTVYGENHIEPHILEYVALDMLRDYGIEL